MSIIISRSQACSHSSLYHQHRHRHHTITVIVFTAYVLQARLPGGLEKRQLAVMHPKQLICTWNDYDLKGFDSEAGFEQVTAAAASAASATNASASSSAAAGAGGDGNAAASAPVGLSGVAARTLADVGLQNRTVLVLRPMDAEAVFH